MKTPFSDYNLTCQGLKMPEREEQYSVFYVNICVFDFSPRWHKKFNQIYLPWSKRLTCNGAQVSTRTLIVSPNCHRHCHWHKTVWTFDTRLDKCQNFRSQTRTNVNNSMCLQWLSSLYLAPSKKEKQKRSDPLKPPIMHCCATFSIALTKYDLLYINCNLQ